MTFLHFMFFLINCIFRTTLVKKTQKEINTTISSFKDSLYEFEVLHLFRLQNFL